MRRPADESGVRISRRRAVAIGGAAAASLLSARGLSAVDEGRSPGDSAGGRVEGEGDGDPIRRVHEAGITGSGVSVAVLDPTGFDPSRRPLSGAIETIRQFGDAPAVAERTTHGTAAAAAVARLAPDARLSLASFDRTAEFVAAIDWCRAADVDVVLAPVAAHGTAGTRRSAIFRASRRAVASGCVVVAPTGNAALGHWEGPYAALTRSNNGSGQRLFRVRALPTEESVAGRFRAWLVVDPAIETDLSLALFRSVADGRRWNLIAVSQPTDSRTGTRLVADLVDGDYALAVRPSAEGDASGSPGGAAGGPDRTGRVAVTTPTHALASPRPSGSIAAPASVPGVVGVGASASSMGADTGGVAPYSGRGPTPSGTVGVDVIAPQRPWTASGNPGTSAAAARVAGVATLICGVDSALAPNAVTDLLRTSAADVGRPGRDFSAGWGRLDALAAVQRARARTRG
ncbi:MAG: S8 family serine peptidase [Haloquadratum sp.]